MGSRRPGSTPTSIKSLLSSRIGLNTISILAILLVWQASTAIPAFHVVVPSVGSTVVRGVRMFSSWEQVSPLLITLRRIAFGFVIGSAAGVLVGALMGRLWLIRNALEPYVHFLRSVTPVAWVVPATILVGSGEMPLYFIVIYASVFPVLLNTMAGFAQVSRSKVRMAAMFGASSFQIFRSIELPCAVPFIVTGMRLGLGYSFMSVVGGEMVAGSSGLGFLIYSSRVNFDSATMFSGIIVVGIAGFLGDRLFVLMRKKLAERFFLGQEQT